MVRRRGNKICVLHGSPKRPGSKTDKPKGSAIKCYSIGTYGLAGAKRRAEKMHRAIMASKARLK